MGSTVEAMKRNDNRPDILCTYSSPHVFTNPEFCILIVFSIKRNVFSNQKNLEEIQDQIAICAKREIKVKKNKNKNKIKV